MKTISRANRAALLAASILGLTTVDALAKTAYVEKFGADDSICARSAPCATIQHAITTAGPRGRVIVGPGTYEEPISIVEDNVRVISAAGAVATIIDSTAAACPLGDTAMVCLQANGVVFGQKNRGFTITGDFAGEAGLRVDGDRVRIESNIIKDENSSSDRAIELWGGRATIRYNRIMDFDLGIWVASGDNPRNQVVANQVQGIIAHCIWISNLLKGNNQVRDNVVDGCGSHGISLYATADSRSNNRVQNNLVRDAGVGFNADFTNGDQVKSNLFMDFRNYGLRVGDVASNLVFSNNTLTGSNGSISSIEFRVVSRDPIRQFANNNISAGSFCSINFSLPVPDTATLRFSRNFWGDTGSAEPNLACALDNGTSARDAGLLIFNPSATPRPMRYRNKF